MKSVFVTIIADLSRLPEEHFWNMMDFHGWTHPYDSKGRRREYSDLPKTIKRMEDDPYRSLAGELRSLGGFAKDSTPFSEFFWADFLRPRIKSKAIKADFAAALTEAMTLAKTGDADYLPAGAVRAIARRNRPRGLKTKTGTRKAESASVPAGPADRGGKSGRSSYRTAQ